MERSAYSPFKIVHHPEVLNALRSGQQPHPLLVQIVLSDLCNQSCSFCAYRMEGYTSNQNFGVLDVETGTVNNNPNRMLPAAKAIEILDDCRAMGVKAIEFTGGGEPTAHPAHLSIFEAALDRGLEIALVTNGMALGARADAVVGRASWVRFSVDAGSPQSYEAIRKVPGSMYSRVLDNIRRITSNRQRPQIVGISYVVLKENWPEVLVAVERARDLGVDYFRLGAVFTPQDEAYYAGILPGVQEICAAAAAFATPTFTVFNQFSARLEDLYQHSPEYKFCGHMNVNTYIGADQNVYRCCALAYNDRGLIGSLKTRRFADLWSSKEKQDDFRRFDARSCDRCPFNAKNRFINYCLEPAPMHVNYA